MNPSNPRLEGEPDNVPKVGLDAHEIDMAKKASRAFAITYVNEIHETIGSVDPAYLKKFKASRYYPYALHVVIDQKKPGEIDQLDVFLEKKRNGDICEVKDILHSGECESSFFCKKIETLCEECIHWRWQGLEVNKLNTKAISEGKRVGISICVHSLISSPHHHEDPLASHRKIISLAKTHSMNLNFKPAL